MEGGLLATRARCRLAFLGWNSAELGRLLGVERQTVRNWLSGRAQSFTPDKLSRLAAALGVSVRYLVDPAEDAWQELWSTPPPG